MIISKQNNKRKTMKYWIFTLMIVIAIFNTQQTTSQEITASQLSLVDVESLSDEQISTYWNKARSEGYTLTQLEVIAKSKGMTAIQFSKLKQRISSLKYSSSIVEKQQNGTTNPSGISNLEKFGLEGKVAGKVQKSALFGFDFFSNPNISFTPNLNLATPTTYQLGPGDELLIDIWGAAQNNYRKEVDRQGAIRIENIGPIYVSGLSVEKATAKIISYLKKIYNGIGASDNSYSKVYAEVSLVGVRTVQVNIIGEVKVPGTYSLSALSSVLNALYAAGGPTEKGTFRSIKVVREGRNLEIFDIYKYLINGDETGNVLLRDQDIIIVRPYFNKVEVIGNVKRPGLFELKEGETLNQLVNYFSGFTANAYKERLFVERVNGSQKEMSEISLTNQNDFVLNDGDKLTVGAVIDRFENRVSIGGAVYRPGNFELTENLKLSELIKKAEGLKDNAFVDRGVIYRTIDDVNVEMVSFSVKEILEKKSDIILKREDNIQIFSKESLKESYTVSIDGAINNPQKMKFIEKMQLEDLIAISGGFKDGADVNVIDISRRINDDNFETISKSLRKSSTGNLETEQREPFYLEPYDRVSVRFLKGYTKQKNVSIQGEIMYPGTYSITHKDERISDLINKAGGFSPFAYFKGVTLRRKFNKIIEMEQVDLLQNLIIKDSLVDSDILKEGTSIGVDIQKIMSKNGQKSKYDLILEEGDVLIIPSEKQTVEVRGEVLAPAVIRYDKRNSFKDYIYGSGGFSQNAKKGKAYVVYANGAIRSTKSFLFFKSYPKIEPGAIILVPQKAERKGTTLSEIIGISTALGTLGLLFNAF
jgi:protein involved in polysaccharide export with SLBB domain